MSINVNSVRFSYRDSPLFDNLTFEIKEGDFVAVIGPNGAGKTTLLKMLLGLIKPQSGSVMLFGRDLSKFEDWSNVGYVPQKISIGKLFPGTVEEILSDKLENKEVNNLLGVTDLLGKRYIELSGGQQQRVLVALALQKKPKLLFLDEPTVGVDSLTQQQIYGLLKDLNKNEKTTILLVTHDVSIVPLICKSVLCINKTAYKYSSAKNTGKIVKEVYGGDFAVHHYT